MRWRVQAWVTDPGDFPGQQLKCVEVDALTVRAAIRRAERRIEFQIDAVVVAVTRVEPPLHARPGEGSGG